MAQCFFPPNDGPVSVAPSLAFPRRGVGTSDNTATPPGQRRRSSLKTRAEVFAGIEPSQGAPYPTYAEPSNPTVVPLDLLEQFHFAFLIRHPRAGIPSYYRCCIPPLDEMTGFHGFRGDEAGYVELRRLFDFLRHRGMIGPELAGKNAASNGVNGVKNGATIMDGSDHAIKCQICVIDADDLLDKPAAIIEGFCQSVGIDYHPDMLNWDSPEEEKRAANFFEKWKGFHEDAIYSRDLKPRGHKRVRSVDEDYLDWSSKYGKEGADAIRKVVDQNVEHYNYLKQFALKV